MRSRGLLPMANSKGVLPLRVIFVFQVKIPQVSLIRQLIRDAVESFTIWISAPNRDFF